MKPASKLLVLEAVLTEGNDYHPGKFMDINMLIVQGGKERTEQEFKQLAASAGLQYIQSIPTGSLNATLLN